jgi:hypothetical protein
VKTILVFNAKGGLGNQLFVAAAALSLSKNLNCKAYISMINIDQAHQETGSDIRRLNFRRSLFVSSNPLLSILVRIINTSQEWARIKRFFDRFTINFEDQLDQQTNVHELIKIRTKYPNNKVIMVEGYFQDFSYANDIKLSQDQIIDNRKIAGDKNFNYCAVHVRLGDMLRYKSSLGVLSEDYYKRAIEFVKSNMELEIQLVSDDFKSALLMLPELESNIDDEIATKERQDSLLGFFRILGAKGVVVSNSTYSYWAAFLSKKAKIVVAPAQMSFDQKTIVRNLPPSWKLIDSGWER